MKTICIILSLLGLTAGFCSNGWIRYDDSCYFFEDTQKEPWNVARHYCVGFGADLVKIESERENNFIRAELHKLGAEDQFWTAGNDLQIENEWVWASTNTRFEYTDWSPGEPNQSMGQEDCMTFYSKSGYHWNDAPCGISMYYICEHEDPVNVNEIVG